MLDSIRSRVAEARGTRTTKTIAIFDLAGSTPMKLLGGHTLGTRAALLHNLICREIAGRRGGMVVKELGDGVIVAFDDPVSACLAAVEIKAAAHETDEVMTKGGLTIGAVEEMEIAGIKDFLGMTVDRCARIQSMAAPGQILLDSALHDAASSFLRDLPNISVGPGQDLNLKGIGPTLVYELSTKDLGFVGHYASPLMIHEDGRLTIDEKVAFMQNAESEVIELGIGLRTFTGYFTSRRRTEFKDHVLNLLQRGVDFKCMLLNPASSIARIYAKNRAEKTLCKDISFSIRELKRQQQEFDSLKPKGSFEIVLYAHLPSFHAVCVDPQTDAGRITVSNYLHGVFRAEAPVLQFSKVSNKEMFSKYWLSMESLLRDSKQL
jgi:class 3 adenylate cyclase